MIKNMYWSSYKVSIIVVTLQRNLNFADRFFEDLSHIKFHKICPVVAESFHADGRPDTGTERQTDMTKLIVDFAISRMSLTCKSIIIRIRQARI